jgi:hypothetical protein
MTQEYWVVGGSYRDVNFATLEQGKGEVHGPFPSYDDALKTWRTQADETRADATRRYSIVVTASPVWR